MEPQTPLAIYMQVILCSLFLVNSVTITWVVYEFYRYKKRRTKIKPTHPQ